jgi:hypothetical protein
MRKLADGGGLMDYIRQWWPSFGWANGADSYEYC